MYNIEQFLSREKTFANLAFLWQFAKVFCAKIYFQAIRYRASGCGALGYRKFVKAFSRENLFSSNSRKFSPVKETRYTVYMCNDYIYLHVFFHRGNIDFV